MAEADDLIATVVGAAQEFAPAEAESFAVESADELAAFRQQRFVVMRDGEFRAREVPAFNIPDRYADQGELFVVFECFVRRFLDPLLVAAEIPDLVREVDESVEVLSFERFGSEESGRIFVREDESSRGDANALMAIAVELGRDLFGDRFRIGDFVGVAG